MKKLFLLLTALNLGCAHVHAWPAVLFNPTNGAIVIPTNLNAGSITFTSAVVTGPLTLGGQAFNNWPTNSNAAGYTNANATTLFSSGTVPAKYLLTYATNYSYTLTVAGSGDSAAWGTFVTASPTSLTNNANALIYMTNVLGYWQFQIPYYGISYTNTIYSTNGLPPTSGWVDNGDIDPPPTVTITATNGTPFVNNLTPAVLGSDPAGAATAAVSAAAPNYYNVGNSAALDAIYTTLSVNGGTGWVFETNQQFTVIYPMLERLWTAGTATAPIATFAYNNTNVVFIFSAGSTNANGQYNWFPTTLHTNAQFGFTYAGLYTNPVTGAYIFWNSPYFQLLNSSNLFLYKSTGIQGALGNSATGWQYGGSGYHGVGPAPASSYQRVIDFSQNYCGITNIPPTAFAATNAPQNGYALRYTNGSFYWAP